MKEFTWDKLLDEMKLHAPMLLSILQAVTHTKRPRTNTNAVTGMCTAILLKHRFSSMCLVQKIVSLVMFAGRSGKQV